MLTIRHIAANYEETVRQVQRVRFQPWRQKGPDMLADLPQTLWLDEGDPITEGITYVMNDAGKTVATYDMRPPASTIS